MGFGKPSGAGTGGVRIARLRTDIRSYADGCRLHVRRVVV